MNTQRVIYDFGSNNGDDIPYYLLKGDVVVAVEANPVLTKAIEDRFKKEISLGRLFVENCVLTAEGSNGDVLFYLHKGSDTASQFPRPSDLEMKNFQEVTLPSKSAVELIKKYGDPYYIKIDIEGYDEAILSDLFSHNIFPPYLSAESHTIKIFSLLQAVGKYQSFNLIIGDCVPKKYMNHQIKTSGGTIGYSFPADSAGPFGEDIIDAWMSPDNFFTLLALEGLGWKDIHVSSKIPPTKTKINFTRYALPFVIRKITPKILRPLFIKLGFFSKYGLFK